MSKMAENYSGKKRMNMKQTESNRNSSWTATIVLIFFTLLLTLGQPAKVLSQTALEDLDSNAATSTGTQAQTPATAADNSSQTAAQPAAAATPPAAAASTWVGTVTASPSLNVRNGAWGTITGNLKKGSKVTVTGKSGEWYTIQGGGFVFAKYISRDSAEVAATEGSAPAATSWTGYVFNASTLNIRIKPWGTVVDRYEAGRAVKVIGKDAEWYKIDASGRTLFAHSSYISKDKPADSTSGSGSSNGGGVTGGGSFGGRPVAGGRISSNYGWRNCPFHGREFHNGVDIAVAGGTPIKALGPGKVIFAANSGGYGNLVKVKFDNGYIAYYAHLKSMSVTVGQRVNQNQTMGAVNSTGSSTGNHLHFELRKSDGTAVNPNSVSGVSI
ncbi:MAG: hypothetical protein CVV64_12285 [Candidatus Wallbacteria bacterium HGW-Wallbacteria-1]|uniref:SH3b domain-containing protein n=1 Tax=Candidatus Wallbacteria bacterium HGW-Wallbacteria-1 TaxID=2013854 RepID=A0A2N1PNJ7_9BACT|nr:MAG: hypothetical protein CVV64_12285 [Candidatus Wallbacteria bacterium HGW-Wallbacteria-1]